MRIDWLTEITGYPVCFATRSAVRCRVPDSEVSMVGSGRSWTAARRIRLTPWSTTIAPSIFASSRRRVEENSTSRTKPPEQICSTVSSCPRTMSAPVRPRRIRSSPSRSAPPGATAASVVRSRSSGEMGGVATAESYALREDRGRTQAAMAWARSSTSSTCIPSGAVPLATEPGGTTARVKPHRAASDSRRPTPAT